MTRRKKKINKLILCACGKCGLYRWLYDERGREKHYIKGHSFFGKKHSEETRKKMSKGCKGKIKSRGENHGNWKGDKVGYKQLHIWLRRNFPKPDKCHMCLKVEPKEIANITGIYNREFKNWAWFCYSCHKLFDNIYERNLKPYL